MTAVEREPAREAHLVSVDHDQQARMVLSSETIETLMRLASYDGASYVGHQRAEDDREPRFTALQVATASEWMNWAWCWLDFVEVEEHETTAFVTAVVRGAPSVSTPAWLAARAPGPKMRAVTVQGELPRAEEWILRSVLVRSNRCSVEASRRRSARDDGAGYLVPHHNEVLVTHAEP